MYNILICDDDKQYVEEVKKHVKFFMSEKNIPIQCFTYNSGEGLLNTEEFYDIAFLDVEIDDIKSFGLIFIFNGILFSHTLSCNLSSNKP